MFAIEMLIEADAGLCHESFTVVGEGTWAGWKNAALEALEIVEKSYGRICLKKLTVTCIDPHKKTGG